MAHQINPTAPANLNPFRLAGSVAIAIKAELGTKEIVILETSSYSQTSHVDTNGLPKAETSAASNVNFNVCFNVDSIVDSNVGFSVDFKVESSVESNVGWLRKNAPPCYYFNVSRAVST